MFQVGGDIEDLESVLTNGQRRRPLGSGSCSALVKLLEGNKDLYVAQDTWNGYESMLRILKVYDFPWKTVPNGTGEMWGGSALLVCQGPSGLQLGRAEVLRGLRNFLNMDRPEHHSIDRLKERGVEKGSGRHSTLQG